MTDHEMACLEQGRQQERRRIFDLIARLELGECKCERWLTEMYTHASDCDWNNEITYRSKLLVAITAPAGGDGIVPDLSSPAVAAAGQPEATGD